MYISSMDASISQISPPDDNAGPSTSANVGRATDAGRNKGGMSRRKKPRLESKGHSAEPNVSTLAPKFLSLPLELLAEILYHTHSPAVVLAVVRCCKALCHTLLNPTSNYIWRSARQSYVCPLPDPCEIFTEASYAAFVFDGGECEICKRTTEAMYTSFSLRLRLCSSMDCRKRFITSNIFRPRTNVDPDRVIMQWVPLAETAACFEQEHYYTNHHWPHANHSPITHSFVWSQALHDYNTSINTPNYLANKATAISNNTKWIEFCVTLYRWKLLRVKKYDANRALNEKIAREFAAGNGWEYKDMLDATPYGKFHRDKNRVLEGITTTDLAILQPDVETCLLNLTAKRKRRTIASAQRSNRADIDAHYARLKNSSAHPILPSLPVFRKLPVLSLLESTERTGVGKTLAASSSGSAGLMGAVLQEQVRTWVDEAREGMAEILGCKEWKSANGKLIHPVERLTARFRCKECQCIAHKYVEDGCLDFRGVCSHECVIKDKEGRKAKWKPKWSKDMFERDEQAIAAMESLTEMYSIDEKYNTKFDPVNGVWLLCSACSPSMVLHPKGVIGHSHRHPAGTMALNFLLPGEAETYLGVVPPTRLPMSCAPTGGATSVTSQGPQLFTEWTPFGTPTFLTTVIHRTPTSGTLMGGRQTISFGMAQKLLNPGFKMRKAQDQKVFGCRYCLRAHQERAKEEDNESGKETSEGEGKEDKSAEGKGSEGGSAVKKDGITEGTGGHGEGEGEGEIRVGEKEKEDEEGMDEGKGKEKEKEKIKKEEKLHLFIWNGMRSHMKAKHSIEDIRDEDFFSSVPLSL